MPSQTVIAGGGSERFRTLDMMRGIAAVIVILFHEEDPHIYHLGGWSPRFSLLTVDMFFCLSGFVIAKNYDGRFAAGLTLAGFMKRRIRRLAPIYLIGWVLGVLTLAISGTASGVPVPSLAVTMVLNLFLLPGTFPVLFPLNPPGWTLFLELWVANLLYALLWPWLRPIVLGVILATATVGLLFVAVHLHRGFDVGSSLPLLTGGVFRVVLSFFLGVAVSRLHAHRPARVRVPAILLGAALLALLAMPFFAGRLVTAYQLFCIWIGLPALIYLGANAKERRPAIGMALGDASYAAYVIHWPLLGFLAWGMGAGLIRANAGPALQLTVGALVVLLAFGLHHALDLPARNRSRRRALQNG